jgi:hypothetical protein
VNLNRYPLISSLSDDRINLSMAGMNFFLKPPLLDVVINYINYRGLNIREDPVVLMRLA